MSPLDNWAFEYIFLNLFFNRQRSWAEVTKAFGIIPNLHKTLSVVCNVIELSRIKKINVKILSIVLFISLLPKLGVCQYYETDEGKKISYTALPSNDDFMEQYILGDIVYKSYSDTTHHFKIQIPDSFDVRKTNSKNLIMFRLPIRQGVYDYISITSFEKDKFISLDSLIYKNLTRHKIGEYLNGNKNGIFQSVTSIDSLTYKVELLCSGNNCTQEWCFKKNNFGYYVIMLACKRETYSLRQGVFKKFISESFKFD